MRVLAALRAAVAEREQERRAAQWFDLLSTDPAARKRAVAAVEEAAAHRRAG